MRQRGMLIAVGLVLLVNAIVLVGAATNRSGEPDAVVTLTERELPLSSYDGYADRENTGLGLRLNWSQGRTRSVRTAFQPAGSTGRPDWFDKAKLEAVGFDCTMPLDDPHAEIHYAKMLPRKTYAVLEYEGNAWEAWLANERKDLADMASNVKKGEVSPKQLTDARQVYERDARTHSRLCVVDVGNDPAALRQQYGDRARFLIFPATVRLSYYKPGVLGDDFSRQPWQLSGLIEQILTDEISVPKGHRAILEKLLRTDRERTRDYSPYAERQRDPAYAVTLPVGKRHEPWVAGIRPLATQAVR